MLKIILIFTGQSVLVQPNIFKIYNLNSIFLIQTKFLAIVGIIRIFYSVDIIFGYIHVHIHKYIVSHGWKTSMLALQIKVFRYNLFKLTY